MVQQIVMYLTFDQSILFIVLKLTVVLILYCTFQVDP